MEYEQSHQQKRITLPTGELYLSHRQMQSRIVESCSMMISEENEKTSSDAKKSSENIIDFDLKTAIDVGNTKTIRLPFASNKLSLIHI